MTIKTILVDDEPKALSILQNKIERFCPKLNVVATTQNPSQVKQLVADLQPDLLFLDIAMPKMSGFDVLCTIDNPSFEIIFATAFDDYAIEAISHSAIGYLVKPIDNELLIATVNKAITNIEQKTALEKNKLLIENLGVKKFQDKKIVVPSTNGLEFLKVSDIVHCEGVDGYTKIHLANKKSLLSSQSIGHFNKILTSNMFYLIHKSHVINVNYIIRYLNEGYVELSNHNKLPVSRSKRTEFLEFLKSQ